MPLHKANEAYNQLRANLVLSRAVRNSLSVQVEKNSLTWRYVRFSFHPSSGREASDQGLMLIASVTYYVVLVASNKDALMFVPQVAACIIHESCMTLW